MHDSNRQITSQPVVKSNPYKIHGIGTYIYLHLVSKKKLQHTPGQHIPKALYHLLMIRKSFKVFVFWGYPGYVDPGSVGIFLDGGHFHAASGFVMASEIIIPAYKLD